MGMCSSVAREVGEPNWRRQNNKHTVVLTELDLVLPSSILGWSSRLLDCNHAGGLRCVGLPHGLMSNARGVSGSTGSTEGCEAVRLGRCKKNSVRRRTTRPYHRLSHEHGSASSGPRLVPAIKPSGTSVSQQRNSHDGGTIWLPWCQKMCLVIAFVGGKSRLTRWTGT
jgi:hypothetical protein